jgi:hypothetical protein
MSEVSTAAQTPTVRLLLYVAHLAIVYENQ